METKKPRVFIASSGRAITLAKALEKALGTTCEAEVWVEAGRRALGKTIINMLVDESRRCDFAVIILTKDDIVIKKGKDNAELHKARDNCVFEAGLFTGALSPERCFLIVGVKSEALPSDLGGVIHVKIEEPKKGNLRNLTKCKTAISDAAVQILNRIKKAKKVVRNLSIDQIFEREKVTTAGGDLVSQHVVVVATTQPKEITHKPALQVWNNIKERVNYIYFFEGNETNAKTTCDLLRSVLLAPELKGQRDPDKPSVQDSKFSDEASRQKVIDNLRAICENEGMKIYFLPFNPKLQYVIHNATSSSRAILYLKKNTEYLLWETELAALQFWEEMRGLQQLDSSMPSTALFFGAKNFDIKGRPFYSQLEKYMKMNFPADIRDQVLTICCEGLLHNPVARETRPSLETPTAVTQLGSA